MKNPQDIEKRINFVHEGMELGSKAGFRLSTLYALLGVFLVEVFGGSGYLKWLESVIFDWQKFIQTIPLLLVIVFIIFFVAIGPATILGVLTGMLLGKFAEIFKKRISKYFLVFSSALLCLVIDVLIHLFFDINTVFSFQQPPTTESSHFSMGIYATYPFYMGIPTVLYVLAGGWTGWRLYLESLSQTDE